MVGGFDLWLVGWWSVVSWSVGNWSVVADRLVGGFKETLLFLNVSSFLSHLSHFQIFLTVLLLFSFEKTPSS